MPSQKFTLVRISDEQRQWIDFQRAQAGLTRGAFVRALLAEVMAQRQADQAQIRSRAAGAR